MLFIEYPPLEQFRIDFKFKKPDAITFKMMSEVEENLSNFFSRTPSLNIIEYPFDTKIEMGGPIQIGPISFQNEDKSGRIQLFSNGLIFTFTKYTRWEEVGNKIKQILFQIVKILNIDSLNHFRMELIDKFVLTREGFNLFDYFNLNINVPEDWNIDYEDFHMGIKIQTDYPNKFIIRLRGMPSKEDANFIFRLESLYLYKQKISLESEAILSEKLDDIHILLDNYFINVLNQKLKDKIGLTIK